MVRIGTHHSVDPTPPPPTGCCKHLQLEGYEYPPVIVDAYKSTATAVGVEDISPVYIGVGVIAASGVLLLACRSCKAAPQKKKGRGSKKSKGKAKLSGNGSAHKNGGNVKSGAAAVGGAAVNGGSGTRGLPIKQPNPPTDGAKAAAPKPAKKAPTKAPQSQGKGKGKPVNEPPPVITVSEAGILFLGNSRTCRLLCRAPTRVPMGK